MLRKELKNIEAQIERSLAVVAEGIIADIALLKSKLEDLNQRRDECIRHLASIESELPEIQQTLSRQQATTAATHLKCKLLEASKALQRRHVRGLVSEIVVASEKTIISGPRAAIAACASNPK